MNCWPMHNAPNRMTRSILLTLLTVTLLCTGCAVFHASPDQQAALRQAALIDIQHAGLLLNAQNQAELGLSIRNTNTQILWVVVHILHPDRTHDCLLSAELPPTREHFFVCVQPLIQIDVNYPIKITAYSDLAQTQAVMTLETGLQFTQQDLEALSL